MASSKNFLKFNKFGQFWLKSGFEVTISLDSPHAHQCMCVCVFEYKHVYVSVYLHLCVNVSLYMCVHVCACLSVCACVSLWYAKYKICIFGMYAKWAKKCKM